MLCSWLWSHADLLVIDLDKSFGSSHTIHIERLLVRAAENLLQAQEEIGPLLGRLSHSPTLCVMSLLLSELISHTGATNMTGPLAIGTALSAGFNPVLVAVDVALSASLGFMLPVTTPPNAIVYASGYVPHHKDD